MSEVLGLLPNRPHSEPVHSVEELRELFDVVSRGKRMWEATFDAIVDPVLIVSSDFEIKKANLASASSGSVDVRRMIGQPCYCIFAKRESPCEGCPLVLGLDSGFPKRQHLQPYADHREFIASAFPIHRKEGSESESLAVIQYQDFTAIKKLETQLRQHEKMASLGFFASGIAHEINNPLGGILAFSELAMEGLDRTSSTYQDLKEIEHAVLRCKRIVEELLEFARPSAPELNEQINLNQLIEEILPSLQVQWKNKEHHLNLDLGQISPVDVSVGKIKQVFVNLLANAFHAIGPGGTLVIKSREVVGEIFVEIQDDGDGIPPEILKNIFEPYFTSKRGYGGTGLGLSICYNIICEHGGRIEVDSCVGRGSCFKVCLPKGGGLK